MPRERSRLKKGFLLCWAIVILLTGLFYVQPAEAFSPQVIQRGSVGDDVIELQARLQYIGYYTGRIDGVFGWETYWSVRNFQNDFGLDVDGLVGDELKEKLIAVSHFDKNHVYGKLAKGESPTHYGPGPGKQDGQPPGQRDPGNRHETKWVPPDKGGQGGTQQGAPSGEGQSQRNQQQPQEARPEVPPAQQEVGQAEEAINLPQGFSDNDIRLMANAVYGEARGEPYEGQVAIAAVILNRVKSPEFPNSVSNVIFEPLAFTAVMDGQIWLEPDEAARRAVMDAINGWDPTGGKVYYFNPATASAPWMWDRYGQNKGSAVKIGKHIFIN